MFSLQNWKDPDVHDTNSAWVRLFAVILEIDTLCCTILLCNFLYTTFSMHITGKCCNRWLRWIVFDRTAILVSEQPQITPIFCIFVYFPMIFVHCNSGIRQVVLEFLCADQRTSDLRPWRAPHASFSWRLSRPESIQTGWFQRISRYRVDLQW